MGRGETRLRAELCMRWRRLGNVFEMRRGDEPAHRSSKKCGCGGKKELGWS